MTGGFKQVTSFVEALHAELDSIDPEILLTAAVFADYNEAVVQYAQECGTGWTEGSSIRFIQCIITRMIQLS
jgi:hypothetical protein